jgi:hypothetical protein
MSARADEWIYPAGEVARLAEDRRQKAEGRKQDQTAETPRRREKNFD